MAGMSWDEAIRAGIVSAKQAKEARLTTPAARFVSHEIRKPPPHRLNPGDAEAFEVTEWLRGELETLFPGECRVTRRGIEFPRVKLLVEIDQWSEWSKRYAGMTDEFDGWATLRLTASALKGTNRKLDVLQICIAYAGAEAKEGEGS